MLETELKKLTAALEANTAAITGGACVPKSAPAPVTPAPATAPQAQIPPPISATQPPAPPVVAAPPVVPAQPVVTPGAVVPQPMTHEQAQAELGAIVQALGPADTRVQATMVQYGSARLNEIPAENLFSLVQTCRALPAL